MNFKRFANHQVGFSHVKKGMECQDFSVSYSDALGKFHICVVCDGHSDKNCFRSAKGAKFGCESGIEVLMEFFKDYDEIINLQSKEEIEEKVKKKIKEEWDRLIQKDIEDNPIVSEELAFLSEQVKKYYESGRGLENIYGTTFSALGISDEICIVLQIGDGLIMFANEEGNYYEPLEFDKKSETGSPASLCDNDLFTRKNAFRSKISDERFHAAILTTDGIADCMDKLQFMEFFYSLIHKFETMENKNMQLTVLNKVQQKYLESCVKYYTDKGNGVEDDCSLAGIYRLDKMITKVKIPLEIAIQLWKETLIEKNKMLQNYDSRKKAIIDDMIVEYENYKKSNNIARIEYKNKIDTIKEILGNIISNERIKIQYYENKLNFQEQYILRANGEIPNRDLFNEEKVAERKEISEKIPYSKILDAFFLLHDIQREMKEIEHLSEQTKDNYDEVVTEISHTQGDDVNEKLKWQLDNLDQEKIQRVNEYEALKRKSEKISSDFEHVILQYCN